MQSGGRPCAPGCGPLVFSVQHLLSTCISNAISRAHSEVLREYCKNCWCWKLKWDGFLLLCYGVLMFCIWNNYCHHWNKILARFKHIYNFTLSVYRTPIRNYSCASLKVREISEYIHNVCKAKLSHSYVICVVPMTFENVRWHKSQHF